MKVVLGKKGELFVDNQAVSLDGLTLESKKRSTANPNTAALLVADKEATLDMVTSLVDALKIGGVQKIAFSIQKK
jgi:biopolymer transport protein ExbD